MKLKSYQNDCKSYSICILTGISSDFPDLWKYGEHFDRLGQQRYGLIKHCVYELSSSRLEG